MLNILANVSNVKISLIPPVAKAGINFSHPVNLVQTDGPDTKYDVPGATPTLPNSRPSNSSKLTTAAVGSAYPNPY